MSITMEAGISLSQQARTHGLKRGRMTWLPDGWLVYDRPWKRGTTGGPLATHAEWSGPTRLVRVGNRWMRRIEVYLDPTLADDEGFETSASAGRDAVLAALLDCVFAGNPQACLSEWQPPDAADVVEWLGDSGYSTAVDDERNIRLSLRGRGCDGQVRVTRQPGRFRLSLELGAWPRLDPIAENAMLSLAGQANDGMRLGRIAWRAAGDRRRAAAEVDLSGLPVDATGDAARVALWRDLLRLAVGSLDLAQRRLGMELDVLADPRHAAIALELGAASRAPDQRQETSQVSSH
jgi:hypothetical protein